MKKVGVFLAEGFEEIEGLTVVDILRRAGIDVVTVSIMGTKEIHGPTKSGFWQMPCTRKWISQNMRESCFQAECRVLRTWATIRVSMR